MKVESLIMILNKIKKLNEEHPEISGEFTINIDGYERDVNIKDVTEDNIENDILIISSHGSEETASGDEDIEVDYIDINHISVIYVDVYR